MNKTIDHQILEAEVRAAERALHQARLLLKEKRRVLREYRAANLKKQQPPKPRLEERVLATLSTTQQKRPGQIAKEAGGTPQGVRLVLMRLVGQHRARRLGRPMQHTFYMAVPQREAAE